jgi:hypothetical protein
VSTQTHPKDLIGPNAKTNQITGHEMQSQSSQEKNMIDLTDFFSKGNKTNTHSRASHFFKKDVDASGATSVTQAKWGGVRGQSRDNSKLKDTLQNVGLGTKLRDMVKDLGKDAPLPLD